MGGGTVALALAPSLAEAAKDLPSGNDQTDADSVATATDIDYHLTTEVMINGKGPFRFVVDTGADRTVIADDVAASLGLVRERNVMVEGIVRTVPAEAVIVDSLAFGPVEKMGLVAPVLPRDWLRADGYLGLDTIGEQRVMFDFHRHTLTIGASRFGGFSELLPVNQARVQVQGPFGHLRAMDCKIDGMSSTAFIDTGASASIGNSKLFDVLFGNRQSYTMQETKPIIGVTGGVVQGRIMSINEIRLGTVRLVGCKIAIADLRIFDLWGLGNQPALLVGMNFLRSFGKVAIDYGSKELTFDLASLVVARRT